LQNLWETEEIISFKVLSIKHKGAGSINHGR